MGCPQLQDASDLPAPPPSPLPRLPFATGLTNSGMAFFAAKVRARTELRVAAVQLDIDVRGPADHDERSRMQLELTQHLQRSDVHRLLGFVDGMRSRYKFTAIQLAAGTNQVQVTVHWDGRLLVVPAHRCEVVHQQLVDCLRSSSE